MEKKEGRWQVVERKEGISEEERRKGARVSENMREGRGLLEGGGGQERNRGKEEREKGGLIRMNEGGNTAKKPNIRKIYQHNTYLILLLSLLCFMFEFWIS